LRKSFYNLTLLLDKCLREQQWSRG